MRRAGSISRMFAHVLREIEDHGDVAALAGKRGAAAAAEDRSAILARQRDGGDDVIDIAGKNYADRNLTIVGAVGGVQGAAAGVETDFAAYLPRKACSSAAASTTEVLAALAISTKLSGILGKLVVGVAAADQFAGDSGDVNPGLAVLRLDVDGQHVFLVGGNDGIVVGSRRDHVGAGNFRFVKFGHACRRDRWSQNRPQRCACSPCSCWT